MNRKLKESETIQDFSMEPSKTEILGLGSAQRYEYPSSSWRQAESQARINAAFSKLSLVQDELKMRGQQGMETSNYETDVILKDVRTIRRSHDPITGEHRVVVRVSK